jgi:pectate lyase
VGSSSTSTSAGASTGSPKDAAADVAPAAEKDAAADASRDATAEAATGEVDAGCTAPPAAGPLLGWAAMSGTAGTGPSVATTTGGGSTKAVTVTTLADLNGAAGGTSPAVIYVKGVLAAGTLKVGSNKTIAGICGAEIHGHVDMSGSVNVIFRNLKVVGYNCSDSPTQCKSGADAITVISSAHHLWFDHDDISDGSDGNLDITNGSDFVTVSWTKFWYSTARTDPVTGPTGHRFSNLIGAADGLAIDVGHLNITWHHDWWADNVAERMPRSRDGKIHVVNSLFTATGNSYCTNSGNLSSLLVENNVYIGVNNPIQEDADGNMLSRGNVFTNTAGSTTSKGTGFVPPYTLTPDSTANLAATLRAQVGPQ